MAKAFPELPEPAELTVTTNQGVIAYLEHLQRFGLFGVTIEEVAERLIQDQLQYLAEEGWIGSGGMVKR
jgi:tRNA(Glu) U13 pseudouridine synthase TruD